MTNVETNSTTDNRNDKTTATDPTETAPKQSWGYANALDWNLHTAVFGESPDGALLDSMLSLEHTVNLHEALSVVANEVRVLACAIGSDDGATEAANAIEGRLATIASIARRVDEAYRARIKCLEARYAHVCIKQMDCEGAFDDIKSDKQGGAS